MTGLWGKWANANGRRVSARVRGKAAGGAAGLEGDRGAEGSGEGPGFGRGAAAGGNHSAAASKGKSKYRNTRVSLNGMKFDSRREMERYFHLRQMERAGLISGLRRQVVYELAPGVVIQGRKRPALRYVADFVYRDGEGREITEDVKGVVTDVYRVKRHLMKSIHGVDIKEV
ncbi:DUF1064 domain-containing protein [Cupriavidus gilardii]|nr:DUF1064 domain-containing protein [Cupriavidus gilardii]UXC34799.1 DUF1064 domain-containing protein [Cupriavidus gilardii]